MIFEENQKRRRYADRDLLVNEPSDFDEQFKEKDVRDLE